MDNFFWYKHTLQEQIKKLSPKIEESTAKGYIKCMGVTSEKRKKAMYNAMGQMPLHKT